MTDERKLQHRSLLLSHVVNDAIGITEEASCQQVKRPASRCGQVPLLHAHGASILVTEAIRRLRLDGRLIDLADLANTEEVGRPADVQLIDGQPLALRDTLRSPVVDRLRPQKSTTVGAPISHHSALG